MTKPLIVGTAIVGATITVAALLARRYASRCARDFEQRIARMPDNTPRKWMFNNVNAIRRNTDQILHLLERQDLFVTDEPERTAA